MDDVFLFADYTEATWNMFRLNSVKNKVMNVSWFKIYFQ